MLKVGRDKIFDNNKGKERKLNYKDIPYDPEGWVDADKYLPADFDLMLLKTDKNTLKGWSTGIKWDGLRIAEQKILYWKRYE